MYYMKESAHGSSTSCGFGNDIDVLVFDSKKTRDEYVENSENLSCEAIKRNMATDHAANWSMTDNRYNKPNTFSGQYWGIVDRDMKIAGCVGNIEICDQDSNEKRFYN